MDILNVKGLKKSFKDITAVDGISLSIDQGDIHGILGPNGAGKSTTIGCVLGLLDPDEGQICFEDSRDISKWKKNIGYIPQDLAIYPDLTAEENVRFFCSLYGFTGRELKEKTEKALDFVGLLEVKRKKASEYSGGMKRRLNMACGIVHDPKLIIMDEPTVGIDPQSRNRILNNVRELNQSGATIIYTTHYMPEVEEICNRITVIDHGKVVISGSKDEIIRKMGRDRQTDITFSVEAQDTAPFENRVKGLASVHRCNVTLSDNIPMCRIFHSDDQHIMEELIKIASEAHLTITNIENKEPSLEEIFLSLTGKELRDGR